MRPPYWLRYTWMVWLLGLPIAASSGCNRAGAASSPPPKVVVTVSYPLQREVIEWDEYTGHLEAPEFVNVQAQVSGQIVDEPFEEGAVVQKGALLFVIDERPFQADLEAKKSQVDSAEAQVQVAQITLDRIKTAQPGAAVSKQEYDTAVATLKTAQAAEEGAKAAQRQSAINLGWCRVTAPITGRTSRKNITVGNLVTAGAASTVPLTTITSLDPIYLYVDVDEQSILKYQRLAAEKKRISARDQHIPTFMQLQNERNFPHVGIVDFVNNQLDPQTGTLRARGVYPNPKGTMLPGLYATCRVAGSGRYQAILIPSTAVLTQQNLKYVLTLDANNVVQSKTVQTGALFGDLISIVEGITRDDRVIVNGQLRARPGTKVEPTEKPIDSSGFQLTAPGSPTTQELPATRPFVGPVDGAQVSPIVPATKPTTAPTTAPGGSGK